MIQALVSPINSLLHSISVEESSVKALPTNSASDTVDREVKLVRLRAIKDLANEIRVISVVPSTSVPPMNNPRSLGS